jgi:chitinase
MIQIFTRICLLTGPQSRFSSPSFQALYQQAVKFENNRRFLLSVASSAGTSYVSSAPILPTPKINPSLNLIGPENYTKYHFSEMDRFLDFWNLMAYDYAGSWSQPSGHQANLYPSKTNPASTPFSTSAAIDYYISHGVPAFKIVVGMPLYGRTFAGTDGPGKAYIDGGGEGSFETGIWDFKVLPRPGAQEQSDGPHEGDGCGASWSYDSNRRIMVSYDTVGMVKAKAQYVKQMGLGGGMWFESSADRKDGDGKGGLVKAFVDQMGAMGMQMRQVQNCLEYPESKYDNLRAGMVVKEKARM